MRSRGAAESPRGEIELGHTPVTPANLQGPSVEYQRDRIAGIVESHIEASDA